MPAKSKAQQRFFGVVEAYKKGKIKNPSEDVVRVAESMSDDDIKHFASTKHEGLVEKKSQAITLLASAYLLKRHHDKKKSKETQEKEPKKDLDIEFPDEEKRAWQKTPVHVQNGKVEYDFESLEEAAAFLTSIGILSNDTVMSMLTRREGLINGFAVFYPGEKTAQHVVLVDPGNRLGARRRAEKILRALVEPVDNGGHREYIEMARKDVSDKSKTVSELVEAIGEVAKMLS